MDYLIFFNKDFQLELIFTLAVIVPSLIIFIKTFMMHQLSGYKGLKFFSLAFLFFAIAFTTKFLFFFFEFNFFLALIFFYAISVAGLYLVYSLIWKTSHTKEYVLHIISIIISLVDTLYTHGNVMFITMFIVLLYGIIVSHCNYKKKCNQPSQLFFIGISFAFIGYLINFLASYNNFFDKIHLTHGITALTFFIILYGVLVTWQKKGKGLK